MGRRGPGRPRQTSHAELEALAWSLFAERGYDNVSLAEIAKAAGVSRTTLFSYFPAKSDLVSGALKTRWAKQFAYLEEEPGGSMVDVILGAILASTDYSVADHAQLVERYDIFEQSQELRALVILHMESLTDALIAYCRERHPDVDEIRVGDVTRALMAVSAQVAKDWIGQSPTGDMTAYVDARMRPLAEALRPLVE